MSSLNTEAEKEFGDSNEKHTDKDSETEHKLEKRYEESEPKMDETLSDKIATDLDLNDSDENYTDEDDYDYEYDTEENEGDMLNTQSGVESEELKKFEEEIEKAIKRGPVASFGFDMSSWDHVTMSDLNKTSVSRQKDPTFKERKQENKNIQKHETESHCEKGKPKDNEEDVSNAM